MDLKSRLVEVSERMNAACRRAGRAPESVDLMLVTKTVSAEKVLEAQALGHFLFGENKVQEAKEKWSRPGFLVKPEFIGHLQTNKISSCLEACGRIHSVDRPRLLEALDRELEKRGEAREIFLQVKTSEEPSKFGIPVAEAIAFARQARGFSKLKVTGLMTLAEFSGDQVRVRACFRRLKVLFDEIQSQEIFGPYFRHLSMGMSSDYEVAIEEGSTLVRIGTAIFGERSTPDSFYWPEGKTNDVE